MTRTARVEVRDYFEVEVADEVLAEVMSEAWQETYYHWDDEKDAIGWLAWVLDRFGFPNNVDGLYGIPSDQIQVRHVDQEREVLG